MTVLALSISASPRFWLDKVTTGCHRLLKDAFDSYRPERHYMRGPGPKWREKYRGGAGKAG